MKHDQQETCSRREVVLACSEVSREAHKALYHLEDRLYSVVKEDLLESIIGIDEDVSRVHVAGSWADIVRIATWKSEPNKGDIFLLLMNSGVDAEELAPFRGSETGDIFPWLYYGRRLEVLRKICRSAKTNVEKHLKNKETRVYCHLVSEEAGSITASSL